MSHNFAGRLAKLEKAVGSGRLFDGADELKRFAECGYFGSPAVRTPTKADERVLVFMGLRCAAYALIQHRDNPDDDQAAAEAAEVREILGITQYSDDATVLQAFRDVGRSEGFTDAELTELEAQIPRIFEAPNPWPDGKH